jgi:hypothetical protein
VLELLGAAGVTLILVRGDVFAWLRRAPGLRALLKCAMCCGWWVGVCSRLAMRHLAGDVVDQVLAIVLFGGAVSVVATLADFTLAYLDARTH